MSPRISADEAVELLKVHQLRTENKVLYDEVQALREEVKACSEAQVQVPKRLDRAQQTARNDDSLYMDCDTQLGTGDESIPKILERLTACEMTGQELRTKLEQQSAPFPENSHSTTSEFTRVLAQVHDLRIWCADRAYDLENDIAKLEMDTFDCAQGICQQRLDELEQRLEHGVAQMGTCIHPKVGVEEYRTSDAETETVLVPATPSQGCHSPSLSAPQTPGTSLADDLGDMLHGNPMLLDFDYGGTLPDASGFHRGSQGKPDAGDLPVVEDIGAQCAASVPVASEQGAVSTLQTKLDVLLELAQLRQLASEDISTYLQRMKKKTSKLPQSTDNARTYLKRFLAGLAEQRNRIVIREWLDTSQWSIEEAEECALLLDAVIENDIQGNTNRAADNMTASELSKTQEADPRTPAKPKPKQTPATNKEHLTTGTAKRNSQRLEDVVQDAVNHAQSPERVLPPRKCKRTIELKRTEPSKRAATLRGGGSSTKRVRWLRDKDGVSQFASVVGRAEPDYRGGSDAAVEQAGNEAGNETVKTPDRCKRGHQEQLSTGKLKPRPKDLQLKPTLVPSKGQLQLAKSASDSVERRSIRDSESRKRRKRFRTA